jgi:hypothetical protein
VIITMNAVYINDEEAVRKHPFAFVENNRN